MAAVGTLGEQIGVTGGGRDVTGGALKTKGALRKRSFVCECGECAWTRQLPVDVRDS